VPNVAAPSIGDQIIGPVHLPERPNALLAVVRSGVDDFDDFWILENQGCFQKIDFPILPAFFVIP
jgi:hypothetical protein